MSCLVYYEMTESSKDNLEANNSAQNTESSGDETNSSENNNNNNNNADDPTGQSSFAEQDGPAAFSSVRQLVRLPLICGLCACGFNGLR